MKQIISLARKELNSYFSSPMALIFVGVFLAATLFTFFWVDEFFSRGLADLRPMFRWMPSLMIFLAGALTMRQWSEEQQAGTLEVLFTLPMKLYQLVLGKFFAALALVVVSLALTFFLPYSISSFGNPDPGPILGGYLATVLMASAYIAIGLFVSSRTGNQIVSLIVTMLVCGLFQLVGSAQITDLFESSTAELLRAFGTGSRFESIERGVIDLRDLLYYLSLTVIFLLLNVLSLDQKRWGTGVSTQKHRLNAQTMVSLVAANLLALNVLLFPVRTVRLDLTEDKEYSLSDVTRDLLDNLDEPLLIRGYFSEKNHPYLEPLIPRIEDMLDEYKVAAGDKLDVEILDPIDDPKKEAEANQVYGIQPTPLQVSDRYGTSVINVYFDILIRYGDQDIVLNFGDLIEVNQYGQNDIEVKLRNLEYDLTRSIKKVVYGFRSIDAVLASLDQPAQLRLYYTPDTLPEALLTAPDTIQQVADEIAGISNGKFVYEPVNVNDPANNVDPDALYTQFNIQPIAESFLSSTTFYLHMVLIAGDKVQVIYPSSEVSESGIRDQIESSLQRAAPGFLKGVGVWTPTYVPQQDMFGQTVPQLQSYQTVTQSLRENYEVTTVDLSTGEVPGGIDVLLVIAPENLTDIERYAVDQYLMRGGTLLVAAGNFKLGLDQYTGSLTLLPIQNGLQEMLDFYGIKVDQTLVMDPQNVPFPSQVTDNVGGMTVQRQELLPFPFFADVRSDGMDRDNAILSRLPAMLLAWSSPVVVDPAKNVSRDVTTLLKSSGDFWLTTNTNVQPAPELYDPYGFPVEGEQQRQPLAVVVEGSFESFFKGKPSPFDAAAATADPADPNAQAPAAPTAGLIESSPDTARLIVIGSSEFLNDTVFSVSDSVGVDSATNATQFVQNAVDWATEDTDLVSIRSRGSSVRVLDPLSDDDQTQWEVINYAVALISLIVLGVVWQLRKRAEKPMPLVGLVGDSQEDQHEQN